MKINYQTIKRTMTIVGILEMLIGVVILAKLYLGIASLMQFTTAIIVVVGFFVGHQLLFMSIGYLKVVGDDRLFKPTLIKYVNDGGGIEIVDNDGTILGEKQDDKQQ